MNRLCRSVASRLAEESLSPAEECVWGEGVSFGGTWWMKLFLSADIFKPGCGLSGKGGTWAFSSQQPHQKWRLLLVHLFAKKGRSNMLISKIACESICFRSVSPRQNFLEINVCFSIVHWSVREKSISDKSSYFLIIPLWYTTVILLCSLLWKSSIRVNYKYLEVHILSFENAIFFCGTHSTNKT